jgi:lambda family phage portal protein
MSLIDKIIGVFSPRAEFERTKYRTAAKILGEHYGERKFDGASRGRRTSGWQATGTSANAELLGALGILRARSRDLTRNNTYARQAVYRLIPNNVVGTGIVPAPLVEGKVASKRLKKAWRSWGEKVRCDFDGKNTFYGLQRLVMRSVAESGDVIVRKRRINAEFPIQLQVCEGDHLDTMKTYDRIEGGGYIEQGIEFDANGRRVAYWLYDVHPGENSVRSSLTSRRIPASEVLHIYYQERPGQNRGVPWLVASMLKAKDIDEFEQAEIVRQKIAACFAAFVTDAGGDSLNAMSKDEVDQAERIEPGMIEYLPAGKQVSFANPTGKEGYEPFMRNSTRAVASGIGVTYEGMTGDLSNVNFSSGRMGWLEFQRTLNDWQDMIINQFCEGAWAWFNEALIIAGQARETIETDWTKPRREMIDPVKETKAEVAMVRAGMKSWSEMVRQQGQDPDDVLEELSSDMKKIKAAELILDVDGSNDYTQMDKEERSTEE